MPEKRTKTGKSRGGKKGQSRPKAAAAPAKKRPSTPVLVAWGLALIFLAGLLYFTRQSRRLPPLPPSSHAPKVVNATRARTSRPEVPKTHARGQKREEHPAHAPHPGGDTPQVANIPPGALGAHAPETPQAHPRGQKHEEHPTQLPLAGGRGPRLANIPPALRPRTPQLPPAPAKHGRPRLAIVIDDLGPNIGIAKQFASLPFPVTLSVLPFLAHSSQIAKMAHQEGREVILHLPMQPLNSRINPGPGALLVSMSPGQIRLGLTAALDTSPYFDGINNHEGSRLTQDARAMQIVMAELKGRKLFFIDSMTIAKSVGWKEARRMGVPTFKRNVFLDDNLSVAAIRSQIAKAVEIAKARGAALAIGHPNEVTLHALQAAAAYFRAEGVAMVSARDLVDR